LKDNSGYVKRFKYISNDNTLQLFGRLHAELFNSDKMLNNVTNMNIKVRRAPESFYLLATSDDNKALIKILDATLFITHVELKPLFL